jgi:tetratricopeptide repeat protein
MNQLETYLKTKGLYSEAEPLIRRSLAIEEELGTESEIAIRLNNLAVLLLDTNRLTEAEPLILGPDHPRTQTALGDLEILLGEMGSGGSEA